MRFAKRIQKFALMAALLSTLCIGLVWLPSTPYPVPANWGTSSDQAIAKRKLPIRNKLKGLERKAASARWFVAQRTYGLGYIPPDAEIRAVEEVRTRMIP